MSTAKFHKLRPLDLKQDLAVLSALRRDLETQHLLLSWPSQQTDEQIRDWLVRRTNDPNSEFLTAADSQGTCIGYIQIVNIHHKAKRGEFGIAISDTARGQGNGSAMLSAALEFARTDLKLKKLMAETRADNEASLQMHKRAGFRKVGECLNHYNDGERYFDVSLMEINLEP